jgi:aerobic carbon-monoxide dehydrogenase small subunit
MTPAQAPVSTSGQKPVQPSGPTLTRTPGRAEVSLTVNGRAVSAQVAPRTHLADFLREHLLLTGTHLGCEHGICGACTLLIDDAPARSCIAFAAACEGARVQTIEGLENDPIMERLRAAFTAEHALQCGYCTPGMLVTARDIVLRLPDADADRIRLELAGNLCRCTGYVGIVRAIQRVLRENPHADPLPKRRADPPPNLHPAPYPNPFPKPVEPAAGPSTAPPLPLREKDAVRGKTPTDQSITETIRLALPIDTVWTALQDPALIAQCVPGARLTSATPDHLTGELSTALGPIRAQFTGAARVTYRPNHSGTIEGEGQDSASNTHLRASATFALLAASPGTCDLTLTVNYALRGPLAQLGRGPIVRAFAAELAETVARTLEARLRGTSPHRPGPHGSDPHGTAPPALPSLRLLPLLLRALRRWVSRHWRRGR